MNKKLQCLSLSFASLFSLPVVAADSFATTAVAIDPIPLKANLEQLTLTLNQDDAIRIYVRHADNRVTLFRRDGFVYPAPGDNTGWNLIAGPIDTDQDSDVNKAFDENVNCSKPKFTTRLEFKDFGSIYHYDFDIYINGIIKQQFNYQGPNQTNGGYDFVLWVKCPT